jgi:putative membrane protein insertion efficiency factor
MMRIFNSMMILFLKLYRSAISPLFPPSCRFTPTCSAYALQAFQKYPFFKAFLLSSRRVLKCHPFHPGGHDPLP